MGYTNYWRWKKKIASDLEKFAILARDTKHIAESLPANILLCGWDGTGDPEITDSVISFNGQRENDLDCETFLISLEELESEADGRHQGDSEFEGFAFCKTRKLPYDLAVKAVLLRLAHHYGDSVTISSNGWLEAWQTANELCGKLFGDSRIPPNILEYDY